MNLSKILKQVVAVAIGLVLSTSVLANQWRPISSERLIKLPAPVMAKALEQDFRDSDLATSLTTSQKSLVDIKGSLKQLTQHLVSAEQEEIIPTRHNLLKKKSAYLDEMEQHQRFQR